jgi:type VI secretion system protein ImpC
MATETQSQGAAGVQTLEGGSLLDEILAETKMTPGDEGYEVAKRGVQAFISELVTPKREGEKVDKAFVDALIAEIDAKLSQQIDEILHHPTSARTSRSSS